MCAGEGVGGGRDELRALRDAVLARADVKGADCSEELDRRAREEGYRELLG